MTPTLMSELKEYLRIDGEEENKTLSLFLHAAENTLQSSGVTVPLDPYALSLDGKEIHARYRLAIMMLATHFYEQRTVITPAVIRGESIPLPYGLQYIVLQLKGCDRLELQARYEPRRLE